LHTETLKCFSTLIALPLLDLGIHPEDHGIVIDKKIANCFMLGGLDGADSNKI